MELGPFTKYDLIPMAEQCLYDLQEVIALYNDEALLYQIGSTGGRVGVRVWRRS